MTYLYFHLVFILPIIGTLYYIRRQDQPVNLPFPKLGIALLAVVAFIYTTPWDNYLVARGIWGYGEGRVLESLVIGYVPLEEYLFFVLQPIMTGCFFLHYARQCNVSSSVLNEPVQRGRPALGGALSFLTLALFGVVCLLLPSDRFEYLGLILVWACPVLAFQWAFGGGSLWKHRKLLRPTIRTPTIYLWVVDMIAIEWGIWHILPGTSTGWKLFSLPVEEAVFFLLTNCLVTQGLLLFYQVAARWSHQRGRLKAQHYVMAD